MQKRYARILAVLLCVVMLFCLSAQAAEPYASSLIATHSATITKGTDGYLYVTFTISANRVCDVIGATSVAIQRKSGSSWVDERTYTVASTPELQDTDISFHSLVIKYKPQYSDATYRAVVNLYAKCGTTVSTGTDTAT